MKNRTFFLLILFFIAMSAYIFAEKNYIATILSIKGDVKVVIDQKTKRAVCMQSLKAGDYIITGKSSYAVLHLKGGKEIRITEKTKFKIEKQLIENKNVVAYTGKFATNLYDSLEKEIANLDSETPGATRYNSLVLLEIPSGSAQLKGNALFAWEPTENLSLNKDEKITYWLTLYEIDENGQELSKIFQDSTQDAFYQYPKNAPPLEYEKKYKLSIGVEGFNLPSETTFFVLSQKDEKLILEKRNEIEKDLELPEILKLYAKIEIYRQMFKTIDNENYQLKFHLLHCLKKMSNENELLACRMLSQFCDESDMLLSKIYYEDKTKLLKQKLNQ